MGADARRKLTAARETARKLGVDRVEFEPRNPEEAAVQLVEALSAYGQKLEQLANRPENTSRPRNEPPPSPSIKTVKELPYELARMETDPNLLEIINDTRHPRHPEVMEQRSALIKAIASAPPAAPEEHKPDAAELHRARKREELAALHRDAEFQRITSDPKHPQYAATMARHQQIIGQIAGTSSRQRGAPARGRGLRIKVCTRRDDRATAAARRHFAFTTEE